MSDPDPLHDPHRRSGYDPSQPRVPAGQSTGGQWTDTDGPNIGAERRKVVRDTTGEEAWSFFHNEYRRDGSLAEQVIFNRDRSRIISEYNADGAPGDWDERHTVIGPDGSKFVFETSGDTQTIYDGEGRVISASVWTKNGPEPVPKLQLAGAVAAAPAIGGAIAGEVGLTEFGLAAAAAALFSWLSSRNGPDGTAVLAFRGVRYRKEKTDQGIKAEWVGRLTREQVKDVCGKLEDVQDRTDAAVEQVRKEGEYDGPADFGTKVHKKIADGINSDPKHKPNYIAEVSLLKSKEAEEQRLQEEKDRGRAKSKEEPHYGQRGTIRIDALENRPQLSTVCLYDPKTGKRRLSFRRMQEIAETVQRNFPETEHIIVTEVRPGQR
jgi:hypothetical protein